MIAFIEALKDDTCTPKPAKLNAWVYIILHFIKLYYLLYGIIVYYTVLYCTVLYYTTKLYSKKCALNYIILY